MFACLSTERWLFLISEQKVPLFTTYRLTSCGFALCQLSLQACTAAFFGRPEFCGFVARMGGCIFLFPEVGYVLRLAAQS